MTLKTSIVLFFITLRTLLLLFFWGDFASHVLRDFEDCLSCFWGDFDDIAVSFLPWLELSF